VRVPRTVVVSREELVRDTRTLSKTAVLETTDQQRGRRISALEMHIPRAW